MPRARMDCGNAVVMDASSCISDPVGVIAHAEQVSVLQLAAAVIIR